LHLPINAKQTSEALAAEMLPAEMHISRNADLRLETCGAIASRNRKTIYPEINNVEKQSIFPGSIIWI